MERNACEMSEAVIIDDAKKFKGMQSLCWKTLRHVNGKF